MRGTARELRAGFSLGGVAIRFLSLGSSLRLAKGRVRKIPLEAYAADSGTAVNLHEEKQSTRPTRFFRSERPPKTRVALRACTSHIAAAPQEIAWTASPQMRMGMMM